MAEKSAGSATQRSDDNSLLDWRDLVDGYCLPVQGAISSWISYSVTLEHLRNEAIMYAAFPGVELVWKGHRDGKLFSDQP